MEAATIIYVILVLLVLFEVYWSVKKYERRRKADMHHAKKILDFINQHRHAEDQPDLWHYRHSLRKYDKGELVIKSLDYFSKDIKKIGYHNWGQMTRFLRKKARI